MTEPIQPAADEVVSPEEVTRLRAQVADLQSRHEEMLREVAEFKNAHQRRMRDLEQDKKFAASRFAGDLITALDNFDYAILAARQSGDTSPLIQGVSGTLSLIVDMLKRHGVTVIPSQGEIFDPKLHEAVSTMPSEDVPANTILNVLRQGYMMHDRVLRPASVIVSTAS